MFSKDSRPLAPRKRRKAEEDAAAAQPKQVRCTFARSSQLMPAMVASLTSVLTYFSACAAEAAGGGQHGAGAAARGAVTADGPRDGAAGALPQCLHGATRTLVGFNKVQTGKPKIQRSHHTIAPDSLARNSARSRVSAAEFCTVRVSEPARSCFGRLRGSRCSARRTQTASRGSAWRRRWLTT